ncbi:neprilysin-2-like [Microplitis mediator]|uniref:neprilysin-2-like n=1 Tax=Microplitis mediator TaxID=375433 RepID=UPI002554B234|nr:neprilysin-2-like [Microplitis mediator]
MTNNRGHMTIDDSSWWKRRTTLERGLTIIAVCGVLLCIALAISIGVIVKKSRSRSGTDADNVCNSPSCIHTASEILKNMDSSVNPCDDFYKFACGGFIKSTIIPDDKNIVNTFSIIGDQVLAQLKMIEDPRLIDMPHPFRLVRSLYKKCMNKTVIEEQGLTPLLNILNELRGWPVLEGDRWKDYEFNWMTSIFKLRELGYYFDCFIDFSIGVDVKNTTRRVMYLDQPSLELSREYLIEGLANKIVNEYYRYMVDIAVILGADRKRAEKELLESLEFEMKLAKISLPVEERRNLTLLYNPMTVAELSKKYPSIPWKEYFNRILKPQVQVDDNETTIVNVPSFMSEFEKLMKSTSKRVQANFVIWRVVSSTVGFLNDEIRKRELEFSTALSGRTERVPRWKECVATVSKTLPSSVGALYIRKYFDEDAKKDAMEMVSDIRNQFNKILQSVDWMDEETRKSALEKAASLASHIAYPTELLYDTELEKFYNNLEFDENASYLKNVLNASLYGVEYSISQFRKPVNKSDWISHGRPAVVNAFYSSIENSIQFPAGILQGAFYNKDRPKYLNYGGIGFVIGHEITHGFDDEGRQFNKDGNLVDWWAPSTEKKYLEKTKCIINQYGNYTVKEVGMNLNGINTQGENIADNGGVKEAYLAYREWADQHEPEPNLPGLPYTPRQMFWISAANTWCSVIRPKALILRIITDSHSPEEFRILGSLSNRPEFAEDFQCPLGSKMNPKDKCAVW